MKMLKLAGISSVIFVVSGLVAGWMNSIEREHDKVAAEERGFSSVEEYRHAKTVGYTTKEEWAAAVREVAEKVAKVPASDYEENIRLYKELHKLDPNNERYEQKLSYYETKRDDARAEKQAELRRKAEEAERARVEAEARERAEAEAKCRQDIQCWGEKNLGRATVACSDAVERQAKYQAEWTDRWYEQKFDRWAWIDREAGIISYIGDKVKFQNGFGAWQRMRYTCIVDTEKNLLVEIGVRPWGS